MLVPGIHSDSKIKLQEEVCTRNKRVWVTGERLASLRVFFLFFSFYKFVVESVRFDFSGIQESCLGFSLALRRSSPTPLNTCVYWRHQQWTQKGEVRWREGDEILSTLLCWAWHNPGRLSKAQRVPRPVLILQKKKKSARTTQKHTQTHIRVEW